MAKKRSKTGNKSKKSKPKSRVPARASEDAPGEFSPERVFLQNISFEIAGIRRSLERLSQQLDAIEKRLPSIRSD